VRLIYNNLDPDSENLSLEDLKHELQSLSVAIDESWDEIKMREELKKAREKQEALHNLYSCIISVPSFVEKCKQQTKRGEKK